MKQPTPHARAVVTIARVHGRAVWSSAGLPTLEVELTLSDGAHGRAIAQSGLSGGHTDTPAPGESAFDSHRRRVAAAIGFIDRSLGAALHGRPALQQAEADALLRACWRDGGLAHAHTAAVSTALAAACAASAGVAPWAYLMGDPAGARLPLPAIEIVSGGAAADFRADIQDIMVVCPGAGSYTAALDVAAQVYQRVRGQWARRGWNAGVGEKGGLWPAYESVEQALDLVSNALHASGLAPGRDIGLALDCAADTFHRHGNYHLQDRPGPLDGDAMFELVQRWLTDYPILSIEDPFASCDLAPYARLQRALGGRVQIMGDDLHDSAAPAIAAASELPALCNATLLKPAKAGTLTDLVAARDAARANGWGVALAGRSGDSEDILAMHLAVGLGIGQFKIGALARSERAAKYNEGLRIAEQLPPSAFAAHAELRTGSGTPGARAG